MTKIKYLVFISIILPIILLTSCLPSEQFHVDDVPPISVAVSNNITGMVDVQQEVIADPNNSSTANITAGATFTGTGTSTLGVIGIQVSLKTDQNCTVYIDQSPDNINWDITATYMYISSKGGYGWTIQALNSYYRVRVTNNGSVATTYLRLQSVLCPVANPLPFSTSSDDRLKTQTTFIDDYGFNAEFTPINEVRTIEPIKLVGATFIGATVDPNFWQTNLTGSGNVTQSAGNMLITTGTTVNSTSSVSSVRRARYVTGSSMRYRAILLQQAGTANNVRRWGVADYLPVFAVTDGAYFKLNGTTFGVAYMAGSMETDITSGSFNGVFGSTYTLDTNYHVYEIYWTNSKVYYVIDGQLLHTVTCTNFSWTSTPTLYIWADNRNSNGSTTAVTETIKVMSIYRLGSLQTSPIYKHITTATTTVCKYGAGTLHSIIVNNPVNNTITVYDNTTGAGTVIAIIASLSNTQPFQLDYNLEFSTGLTVVTGGNFDLTCVYE